MKYETRPISWLVGPEGCSIFNELATTVSLDDEGGGEYIVLQQSHGRPEGDIRIEPAEWPTLKAAIDKALTYAKGDPET